MDTPYVLPNPMRSVYEKGRLADLKRTSSDFGKMQFFSFVRACRPGQQLPTPSCKTEKMMHGCVPEKMRLILLVDITGI